MKETQHDHNPTDTELSDFIKYIKKDPDMAGLSLSEQEELRNRIDRKNRYHDQRFKRWLLWSGSVAASICLILFATWYAFSTSQTATVDYFSVMQSFESEAATSGDVQLALSNNRTITIEGEEAQLDYSEEGWVNINKSEKMDVAEEKTVFNQLVVPAGKRSMLTLSDGTNVWINSGSKLVFPVNFDKKIREVFVEGEIYLDVTPDAERPFVVHTKALDVTVLGTTFNVSAYTDQPDLQVVLVSGEVAIQKNGDAKEILKPNQMYSYNENRDEFSISTVDALDYIAWKDGYYVFYSQDLGTVFSRLSKYYDAQFLWDEKIKNLVCSGKLDLKEDLQEVLNSLEKAAPTIEIQKTSERVFTVIVKP